MGKIKYLNKILEFLEKTPVIRVKDVEMIVKNKDYSNLLIHNLVKKGKIKRVSKGWYTPYEDPVVAVFCYKPAYIGLQEALSLHGIWEQETNVVIVTTKKVRTGTRKILESNVIFHRINQKYFFGIELIKYENFFIPVSDLEKTFIDFFYFKEVPSKEVLNEIKKKINRKKVINYLKHYPPKFRKRLQEVIP
jgi:predicted transcriptional regulator of viral defense system